MIELQKNHLVFTFPEIHPKARLEISFQRTLRIPDTNKAYPLPPGLGSFPLEHVDDCADLVPEKWIEHGGVMLPMFQSEALWINFDSDFLMEHNTSYPFAVKVAAGKINALTGETWADGLSGDNQNYLVVPTQPWLDGYCVEKNVIRQFVAMPLGEGYTAEGQITGLEEVGGLQVQVYPMRPEAFEKYWPRRQQVSEPEEYDLEAPSYSMGLSPGGRMRQEIYADEFDFSDWDQSTSSRCFIHLLNSRAWRAVTGKNPPTIPPSARDYTEAGLPWYEYYTEDSTSLPASGVLGKLKSVFTLGKEKGQNPLPENQSTGPKKILEIKKSPNQVREW